MKKHTNIAMYYLGIPVTLSETVDGFRSIFDPKYEVNEAHATLVAPFPARMMTSELDQYFADAAAKFKQQNIAACGFHITSHGYIFYTFDQSSTALLHELHDCLHQYFCLAQHKEKEHSFLAHITIGKFDGERDVPRLVRETLPEICEQQDMLLDRVRLYGILDEHNKRMHVKDYLLARDID